MAEYSLIYDAASVITVANTVTNKLTYHESDSSLCVFVYSSDTCIGKLFFYSHKAIHDANLDKLYYIVE